MESLRWILLAIAPVIVAGVYFWSRAKRERHASRSPLDAANDDVPSFSAGRGRDKEWVDGVGPVRVVSQENDVDEVLASIREDARPGSRFSRIRRESVIRNVAGAASTEAAPAKEVAQPAAKKAEPAVDDLVVLYLVAPRGEQIKGETILSATYAVQMEHGDKKIFHRKAQDGSILFSMANMQEPGYFDIDAMHQLKTRGVTLFIQLGLCEQPVQALDDMLVAAHSLASMLGVQLCNADRKLLDETYTLNLRSKAKRFADLKAS
jgi:cell division protein ZipA